MAPRTTQTADPLRRLLAAWCAALVFALGCFAASPTAHDWLHGAEKRHACDDHPAPATPEHDCAVVLFASGVDLPVAPLALLPSQVLPAGVSPVTAAEFYLVSPRYLRQPERGPPSSRVS